VWGPELVYALIVTPGGAFTASQGLAFVALVLCIGILATARPLLTLVILFGIPASSLAGSWGELGTGSVLGLAALLVLGEHQLRSTDWAELFVSAFELQGVLGIAVAWAWFVVGSTPRGVVLDLGPPTVALALCAPLLLAAGVHAVVFRARARVWKLVRDLGLAYLATIGETVMVGILAAVLLLAPYVALGVATAGVLPLLLAAVVIQALGRLADAHRRRPCPACQRPVRIEASRCPHCRAAIPVARALG